MLDDNFFCVSLFSTFRSSIFWRNWVWGSKKKRGCRTEVVFRSVFFALCRARARKFDARWAHGRVSFSVGFGVVGKNGLAAAVRRVFRVFSALFVRPLFRKLQVVLLFTPPSFCLGVFLFCSHSSWDWGQRRIARVFLGSWPSTLLFVFCFLGSFYQKHCFSPW